MKWVVEKNLFVDTEYTRFLEDLERLEQDVISVETVPLFFDGGVDIEVENPVIVMGSYTLVKASMNKGWKPGAFTNDNFDYRIWNSVYGDDLLNPDSKVVEFGSMEIDHPVFVRPVFDFKVFSGEVIDPYSFPKWREKVISYSGELTEDTLVAISDIKKIQKEYRFFVVDNKIVTGSQYKIGNRVVNDSVVDEDVLQFAQTMIKRWTPEVAFVIDVATTENGPKIIEFNCINSAGFYACDCQKIIASLSELVASRF